MAKDKTFGAKVAKSKATASKICPVCKEAVNTVQFVQSVKNVETGGYRFPEKYIGVCKCNEKEIYG
jgi:hypothetical protein